MIGSLVPYAAPWEGWATWAGRGWEHNSLAVEPPYPSFEAVCPISSEVRHSSLRPVSLRRASLEPGTLAIVTLDGLLFDRPKMALVSS